MVKEWAARVNVSFICLNKLANRKTFYIPMKMMIKQHENVNILKVMALNVGCVEEVTYNRLCNVCVF